MLRATDGWRRRSWPCRGAAMRTRRDRGGREGRRLLSWERRSRAESMLAMAEDMGGGIGLKTSTKSERLKPMVQKDLMVWEDHL